MISNYLVILLIISSLLFTFALHLLHGVLQAKNLILEIPDDLNNLMWLINGINRLRVWVVLDRKRLWNR